MVTYKRGLPVEDRFWRHVNILGENDCWEWDNKNPKNRYGRFLFNGKQVTSHRVIWMLIHGEIPEGMCICHKCDNGFCVNPHHLFLGTLSDNSLDRERKGRGRSNVGENNNRAKLTWEQVREIRKRYIPRKVSTIKLSKEYGVPFSQICRIVHGTSWKEEYVSS